jgi:mono/diheme cytochrome c family protein
MKVVFKTMKAHLFPLFLLWLAACSSSSSPSADVTGMQIVTVAGGPLTAVAGDAVALKVVETLSDGSTQDLPAGAQVAWSGPPTVTATAPDATPADTPYPATGAAPTAFWIANPSRTDRAADLGGVLFVLDAGSAAGGLVPVTAAVTGTSHDGSASVSIAIAAGPDGDATRGATLYGAAGANCAECHGATGQGSPASTDGTNFSIDGQTYSFPAPGLDAEPGNAGAEWSAPLFAIASRADLDDGAVSLRLPMPDWLVGANTASGKPPSTQDLADIFAYMQAQTASP